LKLLLDTNVLIWAIGEADQLSPEARRALEDAANVALVSAASAWEISTKHRIGKLPGAARLAADFDAVIAGRQFTTLPISTQHGRLAGAFSAEHKDPFDRMIAAQGLLEAAIIVSNDRKLDQFGVQRLW